jgi:hypothetical protein
MSPVARVVSCSALAAALVLSSFTVPQPATAADAPSAPSGPLSKETLKTYASELQSAFPGAVNIYFVGKNFNFREPDLADARIVGCAQVAGTLYYVINASNRSDVFVPQSQIQAIHNRK